MEQVRAILCLPALIVMGLIWNLRHPDESEEAYLIRTYPGTTIIDQHRNDDFYD